MSSDRPRVHISSVGTYHPDPRTAIAWTVNDTRGYLDAGPACDDCGACDCDRCPGGCGHPMCHADPIQRASGAFCEPDDDAECIGLPFAYVCLDGGESLCEECWRQAGGEIVECDCREGERSA